MLPRAWIRAVSFALVAALGGLAAPATAADRPRELPEPRAELEVPAAPETPQPRTVRGSLLVHLDDDASGTDVARDAGADAEELIEEIDVQVVSTDPSETGEVADRLREDPRVERVEPNRVRYAMDDPNDPSFAMQSQLFTSRIPAAWDVTHGSATIDIAILDSGIDLNHPDLAARIGLKTDIVNGDATPNDDNGHGTMVAGVAAADSHNAIGVAGAAWDARIMVAKVLDADGSGTDSDIAAGIVWAADNGAEVINLSLGGPGTNATLQNAVNYALSKKAVVVAASGNDGMDRNAAPNYPAAYAGVIAVGATDAFGDVTGFSTRGSWLDVVAQGYGSYTTAVGAGTAEAYTAAVGTSFSTPLVAGVAALVRLKNPTFTPAQVLQRITSTAIDRGPQGFDDHYGWGLVDAYAAVGGRTAAPPPPAVRDDGESDDTPVDARAIGSGTDGTISPEGDIDWYSVDAPSAGTITVTVTPPVADDGQGAQTFDPMVEAFSPTLQSLGTFDGPVPTAPEVVTIDAASAGTYRIRVRNFASSRSTGPRTEPDPYSVTSGFVPGAVSSSPGAVTWIDDVTPARFATDIAASASPTVTFARNVTEASAESASLVRLIDGRTGSAVAATRTYVSGSKTVTIGPTSNLVAGRAYRVEVTGVTDGSSTMSEIFSVPFTVASPSVVDLRSDFNNDGFEDTVIGAPGEDIGSKADGGAVHVLYGSATGAQGAGSQLWTQDTKGIAGVVETGDAFGSSVASGDLNNDGFDDLVVGAPGEDIGSLADAGLIHVILGSSTGLRATGNTYWSQNTSGIPGAAEPGDRFGASVVTGRFDNAAGLDVAVGAPGEGVGSAAGAGTVHFIRGGTGGLVKTGAAYWTQNSKGIDFVAEANDAFGASLASGDFHGDGTDDLAIGTPSDDIGSSNEGTVMLMRGSVVGLRPALLVGDLFGGETPETNDAYGTSVAIADLGGFAPADRYADLVVGIPGESDTGHPNIGRVSVVFSDHTEPWWAAQRLDAVDVGTREDDSRFGTIVAAHKVNGTGVLAVSQPFATVGGQAAAGAVHVYGVTTAVGSQGEIGVAGVRVMDQDAAGVPDAAEANDRFGFDLALLDVDGDDASDLVVGAPFESVGTTANAGAAFVVRDVAGGAPSASQLTQGAGGVPGAAEGGDLFGAAL